MTNPKIALTAQDKTAAAFAAVSKRVDALGGNLGTLKSLSVSALGALAVPISVAGVVGITNEARAAIDGLKDLAEVSGSTVESVSALDKIARDTNGTFEQVSGTLIKFNQVLKDAEPDKGAGAVLKALNLDIEELKRLDPAEALRRTAVALEGFADNGDKARAYQELFGKSVKETVPFLKDLADKSKLQGTVSTEAAEQVDEFNKQIARLRTSAEDAGRSLTIDLVTSLNAVIRTFKDANAEGENFLVTLAKQTELYRLGRKAGQFVGLVDDPAQRFQPTFSADDQSAAELARLTRRPSLVVPADAKDPKKPPKGPAAKDPTAEAQRYLEALQRQLEGTQKLTEVEQALRDLQLGRLGKVTEGQRQAILNTAAEIDAAKEFEEIQKEFDKLEEEAVDRKKDLAEAGKRAYEETRTPLEQLNIELAELQRLLDAGAISFDTFARKSFMLEEALKAPKAELSELDKFTERAAENIQAAFGDELTNVLQGDFDNIGSSFKKLLDRMVAEAIAADIARSFGLGGDSGGGVFKDIAGALFGGGSGAGAIEGIFGAIPSFDVGTDYVPRDMLALIHKGEKITPAAQNVPGAGRTTNFSLVQNFAPGTDRRTGAQAAADARRQLEMGERNL